jgi:hypothetical protein
MIIDLIIKLQEKITELIKERQNRKRRFFEEFYRDIYENLISVHHHYLISLNEIKNLLKENTDSSVVLEFIQSKSSTNKGTRDHIEMTREVIRDVFGKEDFIQAEKDFLNSVDVYLTSYFEGRTPFSGLLWILNELEEELKNGTKLIGITYERRYVERTLQDHMLDEVERTVRWLEQQFSDVSLIYNTLRLDTFNRTKNV